MSSYKFVNFSWDDAKAASLDPVARLVYRSNLLGSDPGLFSIPNAESAAR